MNWWLMGGYAAYVWGAIGAALLLPLLEWLVVRRRQRAALARLQLLQEQDEI